MIEWKNHLVMNHESRLAKGMMQERLSDALTDEINKYPVP